jgi:lactate dehydrogenase-like 2-hydroxyacid dehydrogenase
MQRFNVLSIQRISAEDRAKIEAVDPTPGAGMTGKCATRGAKSDFVVICCQWIPETTRLFDKDRFVAMKPGGRARQRRPG